jgi:hypothetical protein
LINSFQSVFSRLLDLLNAPRLAGTTLSWSSPVPFFGDLSRSTVATVGINPSDREFLSTSGQELSGDERRFHTLNSLGLSTWEKASARDIELIVSACLGYFEGNPYDRWFVPLNRIIESTGTSFYEGTACHLDLVPFATELKWSALSAGQRSQLLLESSWALREILQMSRVQVVVLNGRTVVDAFSRAFGIEWTVERMPALDLHRSNGSRVTGLCYKGRLRLGSRRDPPVLVIGYNHNIQSSFGISKFVSSAIGNWIGLAHTEARI